MIERTALPSGIRVVTERMPEARSATVGFWVGVGGRDEPAPLAGASHFLEHLVFKGTETRSARHIAESVDALGGEMNAFTTREHTTYYVRLPAQALDFGLELLTDVLSRPALRPSEVDAEREVILEELAMSDDTPDDRVFSLLAEGMFTDHPLGREVLGDEATVEAMTAPEIAGFFAEWYRPASVVIAAAGLVDHDQVVDGVAHYLADTDRGVRPVRTAPAPTEAHELTEHRDCEQSHLTIGWRGVAQGDPDRYPLAVLEQVFGGGMASRLFQYVREERGLAYSVYSSTSTYADAGTLVVYAGCAPAKSAEVRSIVDDTAAALATDGVTERELEVALGYLEGSLVLGLEDSGSRMGRIGRSELVRGEVRSVDDDIARIRAVTADDVLRVARRVFESPRVVATVGPKPRRR